MRFCFLLIFILISDSTFARSENPLTASLHLTPNTLATGNTTNLEIALRLDKDYFAYVERFKLELLQPSNLKIEKWEITPQVDFLDPVSKKMKKGIRSQAMIKSQLHIPKELKLGDYKVELQLTYQACKKEYCLFPKKIKISAPFTIKQY